MGAASKNVWSGKIIVAVFVLLFQAIVLTSCNSSKSKKEEAVTTITSGEIQVLVDNTFKPLMGTCIEVFQALNPNAKIKPKYLPQENSFSDLLEGKTDVIIAGRPLYTNEEAIVRNRGLFPKVNKIASDALLFIVSKEYPEKKISEDKIKKILSGELKIQLVCDKSNSANISYLKNRFKLSKEISNVSAAGSDSAVIEYVTKHPETIGIIGMALVSDYEDPKVKEMLTLVNLLSIEYKDSTGKNKEGNPVLEELYSGKYPFIRGVFIINLDGQTNLGTGFANFMVSERAQRIILKFGLLPFKLPSRDIIINE